MHPGVVSHQSIGSIDVTMRYYIIDAKNISRSNKTSFLNFYHPNKLLLMPHSTQSSGQITPDLESKWWNANLPPQEWTDQCPDYLIGQTGKNVQIISMSQQDYKIMSWPECQKLVAQNRIDDFQRSPNALRDYLRYMYKLKSEYGSVLAFVQQKRLNWSSISPSRDDFTNPDDYKILFNDWPYGIDPDIAHLVVWTKFLLEDDPETGFLTKASHDLIEKFVVETFCGEDGVDRRSLVWFKNWKSLKSIHALEHFHVMIYQADPEFLKSITNGDIPTSELVQQSD